MTINISPTYFPIFRRWLFCFAAMLLVCTGVLAQAPWDGSASSSLTTKDGTNTNAGKASNPYLIKSGADLKYLANNVGSTSGKYYLQTADIDLNHNDWEPIGNKVRNNAFQGVYDGGGHTISNLYVNCCTNRGYLSYGLFGWMGGTVKNLVIDDAKIEFTGNYDIGYNNDVKVGVLVGALCPKTEQQQTTLNIQNIIIRNSQITDATATNIQVHSYLCGGVAGDINAGGYNGSKEIKATINIDHVYCDVDIDLQHISYRSGQETSNQINVGGIIGRIRTGSEAVLPQNVIYKGSINVPNSPIGPIYSFARHTNVPSTAGYDTYINGYRGEFAASSYGNISASRLATMYYTDYTVRGTAVTGAADGTNTFTSSAYGTITLKLPESSSYTDPDYMKMFQGVNRGTYLPSIGSKLPDFNTYLKENLGYFWKLEDGKLTMKEVPVPVNLELVGETLPHKVSVTLKDSEGNVIHSSARYRINVVKGTGASETSLLSDEIEVCDAQTVLTIQPSLAADTRLKVTAIVDGVEHGVKVVSLPTITPSLTTADNRTYSVKFNAGYTYSSGLTFDWSKVDVNAFPQLVYSSDKMSVTVNDLSTKSRKLIVDVKDAYGTTVTKDYTITAANLKITYDSATGVYTLTNGIANSTAVWGLAAANGKPLDTTYLTVTGNTATVDDIAFLDRYITVTVTENGADGRSVLYTYPTKIPAVALEIEKDDDTYKAKIGGVVTELSSAYTGKEISWQIFYEDATKETVASNHFTPTSNKNATYTLVVRDVYGEWRSSVRVTNNADTQKVTVTRSGNTLTAAVADVSEADGTWEWRGLSGDITDDLSKGYVLEGVGNTLTINATNDKYNIYYAIWKSTDGNTAIMGFWTTKNVVYVYNQANTRGYDATRYSYILNSYPDGDDKNHGRTPTHAVQTMKRAYEILAQDTSAVNNIVVVMGYLRDDAYLKMHRTGAVSENDDPYLPSGNYSRHATITGSYGEISDGTLKLWGDGENPAVHGIEGATIFRDITFDGGGKMLHIYCNLHDLTMSNNVKVKNYNTMKAGEAGLPGKKDIDKGQPYITIVGGMHNYSNEPFTYPSGNVSKDRTTITILSGCWGRIIASGRNNGLNKTSHNIFGHPDWPHRVQVNVGIKHSTDDETSRYEYSCGTKYDNDIGLLVGGQTDGSVYVDAKLHMISGRVGRFISGNISFGRNVNNGADANDMKYPSDGFFGSTELTLEGGIIGELVGGTLGRQDEKKDGKTDKCYAYFYGRSILNINGGVIGEFKKDNNGNITMTGNIYGAGAGGVVGIGDDVTEEYHTKDSFIPYIDKTDGNKLKYGPYHDKNNPSMLIAKGNMPRMELLSEDETLEMGRNGKRNILDLEKSYCVVNVNGGTINGNVYGGGFGYSAQIDKSKALDQAGDLFGKSKVVVSGGTIKGFVYGGGAGDKRYYEALIAEAGTDGTKIAAANFFKDIANIYGNTELIIKGGIIEGRVFAGSQGIEGYPQMATVVGNTNLLIENTDMADNTTRVPVINGNIFGGSRLGEITGSTHVTINGGAIGNCIFGGSEGLAEEGNKTTAYIGGSTNVTINGGTFFTEEHLAKISDDNILGLTPSDRTFNIYGGGYNNCVINDSTNVVINRSLLTSFRCLIEPDPTDPTKKRSFEDCVNDRTYRKFSAYGAGRGELTDVKKNANLRINIQGGSSVPSFKPVDIANGQQFFMIAGGGMAGHVWGDTNVDLDGNIFARRIYAGGMYGNVLGDVNMHVRRGSYYGVFGGGLLGNVRGDANLLIGTRVGGLLSDGKTEATAGYASESNRNLYIYENVYGGNDVSGCTGYETTDSLWNDGNYETYYTLDQMLSQTAEVKSHHYLFEHWSEFNNGNPYYRHLIKASDKKGVNMKIVGGSILGDVFGAGNGNHSGYYVPNSAESEAHKADDYINKGIVTRMKFFEGLPYHYRVNKKDKNSYEGTPDYNPATNTYTGTLKSVLNEKVRKDYGLYEYRPRVAKVVMHIGGNSEEDRVVIGGDVYGGGHACTIGKYDPGRDVLTDPLRFEGGGSLHINFGSHVTVKKSVYMGSRGRIIGQQTIKGEHDYSGITLDSDMDYHYYDHDKNKYLLGFPNTLEGRNRFHAYVQLVNMDAVTELSFDENVSDLRWGSFFAGGARGSMTKEILSEDNPKYVAAKHKPYEYTLPAGLTIETRVVGGSEDAEITYYEYKETDGVNAYKEIDYDKPIFTFKGGIVYDEHAEGHYGGGQVQWHDDSYKASSDKSNDPVQAEIDKMVGDESPRGSLVVMKLNVNCQFDPQKAEGINENYYTDGLNNDPDEEEKFEDYWGGLVYGGCYNSGITNGSVEVTCSNNMLGERFQSDDYHDYLTWSSLRRNIGRVYGGGFGQAATILGNTKVTLTGNTRCFNVFGGGMLGDVTGGTHVVIEGLTSVYNAVYGGSLRGTIGKASYTTTLDKDLYAKGTHIDLISGGVDRVYGGTFMGNVYGGSHITASDEGQAEGTPRLMVGSIFGGNDVSGNVNPDENEYLDEAKTIQNPAYGYSTFIRVNEEPRADKQNYTLAHESELSGEAGKFYGGFPLIGTIYGAGNGNMGDYIKGVHINIDEHQYETGHIHIASGTGANYRTWLLGRLDADGNHYKLPDIEGKTRIEVTGGTVVNVYGGGSMCTVKGSDEVLVEYKDTVARAATPTSLIDPMTWGVLRLFEDLQQAEVTTTIGAVKNSNGQETQPEILRFSYQIYRVFGGNNFMDMAIQPKLDLKKGNLFSVYSGGNFGRMTYIRDTDPAPATDQPRGLNLTINSPDIRIASVYGGSRVGDIRPQFRIPKDGKVLHVDPDQLDILVPENTYTAEQKKFSASEYGATLNILDGLIGDVYGGNNVAGTVYYGTNVNILGAISGNVYGSGNGNYIYYYDYDNTHGDPHLPDQIVEGYDEDYGGRYFILPKKVAYIAGTDTLYYRNSDEEKLLAINSYRPNVDKAYLNIAGKADKRVFVLGNVYCGGNSSTVLYNPKSKTGGDIKLRIGSYVALGGVFLGSNGESLANPFNITNLANLNGINNLGKHNDILNIQGFGVADKPKLHFNDAVSCDTVLYNNLLSLYMRAAEVTAMPSEFTIDDDATQAFIGNFCVGGNRGSMMTNETIELTLPERLTIFGRIVGGCYDTRVDFHGATTIGGMNHPLKEGLTDKLRLSIKSQFRPWRLDYDAHNHVVKLVNDRQKRVTEGNSVRFVDVPNDELEDNETYFYTEGKCNIFGGCFTSGKTIGGIKIDLYSDVLGLYENGGQWLKKGDARLTDSQGRNLQVDRDKLMNNVAIRRTVYAVTGAGYGPMTEVEGNVRVRLLPTVNQPTVPGGSVAGLHPTIATLFGGGHDGKHIGNSVTEIRDGMVFSSVYGGSRAAMKYGSSEVIVGYPTYYICKKDGTFTLDRADKVSHVAKATRTDGDDHTDNNAHAFNGKDYLEKNHDGSQVIKQRVKYHKGEIVAANVVAQMLKVVEGSNSRNFEISEFFDKVELTPATLKTMNDEALAASWDDIDIHIGDNRLKDDPDAKFYGGGGIYGGGIAINESAQTYSGVNTQLAYTADNNPDNSKTSATIGFGGNSTIIVGDEPATVPGGSVAGLQEHISIGTSHYVPVNINPTKGDKIGTYMAETVDGVTRFIHQGSGLPEAGKKYYKIETEGGIYGDGRRTFVEKFRAVDITGYGYAQHSPQDAKLINTFQRIDLLSLNDCCLQLQGAQDYATNSIDATLYSIARVGEVRMNSSLAGDILCGINDPANNLVDQALATPMSRNYMGFYRNVHFIGAMYSNVNFTDTYRGSDGQLVTAAAGETAKTYKQYKKDVIAEYEGKPVSERGEALVIENFKKRNLGTSPNMVGINNGYTLKLQNTFTTKKEPAVAPASSSGSATVAAASGSGSTEEDEQGMLKEVPEDNIYYGPIVGVVEVKLLTLSPGEGGGYIYAFNQHEADATANVKDEAHNHSFLEETGNFVFASKIETAVENGAEKTTTNYIIDDCYPLGYYTADGNASNHADDEEIHYWYVQGNKYFFNTTLTAYTYNNPINFFLNNADNLIMLSGIEPGNTTTVESVYWQEHVKTDGQPVADTDCALTNNLNSSGDDSRDKYKLYLTIDKETRDKNLSLHKDADNDYDQTKNAFVARIPNGNNPNAESAPVNDIIQQYNTYAGAENSPILGIRLEDSDIDNQHPDFYNAHLSDPDLAVIKIKSTNAQGDEFYYTVNLTIDYLQGPYLSGNLVVENCALPGEYIYANTGKVTAIMDESLTVTGKKWYLYPRVWKYDDKLKRDVFTWDENQAVDISQYMMDNVAGGNNRIQIPARYYQNDWQLNYVMVVNGQEFPLTNTNEETPRLTVHNYHRMSTVAKPIKDMTDTAYGVGISNYGYTLDLDLVGGCLVYIENDEDFEIFTKYVNYCNGFRTKADWKATDAVYDSSNYKFGSMTSPDESGDIVWQKDKTGNGWACVLRAELLPGYNRYGHITGYENDNTVLGHDDSQTVEFQNLKNPSGAEGIRFVLNADVTITKNTMMIDEFRGEFNGLGHTISFGDKYKGKDFIQRNYGTIRDVGFVSNGGENSSTSDVTYVVKSNRGTVENSFYYHFPVEHPETTADFSGNKYSALVGANHKTADIAGAAQPFEGKALNCVQNTNEANANTVVGVRYRPNKMFHNGRVAYNLNREYLHARYISHDDDHQVREKIEIPQYDPATNLYSAGDYLYAYYASGNYRYGNVRSVEHPEGTRLADNFGVPNYENALGNERTMHITDADDVHDELRWFTNEDNGLVRTDIVQIDKRGNIEYNYETGAPVTGSQGYFPIYRCDALDDGTRQPDHLADHSDFIFFGQRLVDGKDRDYYPRRVNSVNRVFRAGGNYGSRTDLGFHFNRDAWALSPELTAIDFTGQADLHYAEGKYPALAGEGYQDGDPIYAEEWGSYYYYYYYGGVPDGTTYDTFVDKPESEIATMQNDQMMRMLVYYPPVLDLPGGDKDHNLRNMLSFNVKSNDNIHDYSKVTKNLLVYTPEVGPGSDTFDEVDNERLFSKLHYTRMQTWGGTETDQNDIIGHHIQWMNHDDDPSLGSHFHAYGGLFHLVDLQDFNAPVEFHVVGDGDISTGTNGRAWILRQPEYYSERKNDNVNVYTDANTNEKFKIGKTGWRSLALPFTANRVFAVNSGDYEEKYSRGEITHFYGMNDSTGVMHHDYWLRGLVGANNTSGGDIRAVASFARPGAPADGLFEVKGKSWTSETTSVDIIEQRYGDYHYQSNWFVDAYKDQSYMEAFADYAKGIDFPQYCYITKNAPYIIAFPGKDYYEFDLSGQFYNERNSTNGCNPQEILYEFTVDQIDDNNNFDAQTQAVIIPVTDTYDAVKRTEIEIGTGEKLAHVATFKRIAGSDLTDNMYVLNLHELTARDGSNNVVTFPEGSVFVNVKSLPKAEQEILPFRSYIEVQNTGSSAPAPYIFIGSRGIDSIGDLDGENDDESPEDETPAYKGLNIFVRDNALVITSDQDLTLPLYGISGQLYRQLTVNRGMNVYRNLNSGVYIVRGKKFVIRK